MGKKEREQEEYELIEFLYKDKYYTESFYSQIFQGDVQKVSKSGNSKQISTAKVKGGIGVASGEFTSSDEDEENIVEEFVPHDSKILKLMDELNVKTANKISEATLNGMNLFHGRLEIVDYEIIKKQFNTINTFKLIEKILDVTGEGMSLPDVSVLGLDFTDILELVLNMQPSGCDIVLTLSNKDKIVVPLEKENLTMKSEDINRIYGNKLPGEWRVVGIFNSARKDEPENQLASMMAALQTPINEMFNSENPKYALKPILIYRKLK